MPNEHIELAWLEDFLALCDSGNFTRAADRQHLTQPALSRRIRMLEEWIGVGLFDRSTQPIRLTEAGRRFRPVAEEILSRLIVARAEAQAMKAGAIASLRFAATHVLSLTFFPTWLRGVEAHLQIGPIHLVSDTLQACEELMLHQRMQFLLCHHHPAVPSRLDPREFQSTCVGVDTLIPVAAEEKVSSGPNSTSALPLLVYSAESGLGRIVRAFSQPKALEEHSDAKFTSHLAVVLKAMMLEGRGIAWLPRSLIDDELRDGRVIGVGSTESHIPVEIHLFRRRVKESPAAEALWQFVESRPTLRAAS
jgi:DNA-binding transcriptional LysR family regulator